jgi:hypothetical protein
MAFLQRWAEIVADEHIIAPSDEETIRRSDD